VLQCFAVCCTADQNVTAQAPAVECQKALHRIVFIYMYINTYMCMFIYIYTYVYTYMHIPECRKVLHCVAVALQCVAQGCSVLQACCSHSAGGSAHKHTHIVMSHYQVFCI